MTPTAEQARALELFLSGGSLAIEAGAGTGKTSTLVILAQADRRRRGQYVAFNKALVTDAGGKFPDTVACNTAHSLAYRAIVKGALGDRLRDSARVPGWRLAQMLDLRSIETTTFDDKPHRISAGYLAGIVQKAITRFCQSADREITVRHFPIIEGLDIPGLFPKKNREIAEVLLPAARKMWIDLQSQHGVYPYKHDHYLKTFQLSDPRIPVDYILFDEAQDANPVIAAIVAAQADHAQLVYVGDSQQEIYAFTGAVNALASIDSDHRTYLTQSFRFGQPIADTANGVLDVLEAPLRLTGNPTRESRVDYIDQPSALLTRTNATGIEALMRYQKAGIPAHLIGGSADVLGFVRAAEELMTTGQTTYPDLACFSDWAAVKEYVEMDPNGEDLRLNVQLVNTYGVDAIRTALSGMTPEARANVVISTAHKSKGREWGTVQLAPDFAPTTDKPWAPSQLRLLYVAVTRAQRVLDISRVEMPRRGEPA